MLEKPDIQDESILACLQEEYGLPVGQIAFLPLGADLNTAVYRAAACDGTPYFVKLRRGPFDEVAVALPKFIHDRGIPQVIAPLATRIGKLRADLGPFKLILSPFVDGRNGYQVELSDRHWVEFGAALKRIHSLTIPPNLLRLIPGETYSPHGRETVRMFLERIEQEAFVDPAAVKTAAFLKPRRNELLDLVGRADRLAWALQSHKSEQTVCHSDIHAGNILIDAGGALYIVDWDNPILAPKERDLMYAGGGQFCNRRTPQEEETLFYMGYGVTEVDPVALAYYRYERIIQDLAVECEQIFLTDDGGEDRQQAYEYLTSNFLPGNVLEIAYASDRTRGKS
jgi:spectinomycin phosphotransferase